MYKSYVIMIKFPGAQYFQNIWDSLYNDTVADQTLLQVHVVLLEADAV